MYVTRDRDGNIIARYARKQYDDQEWVDDNVLEIEELRKRKKDEIRSSFQIQLKSFTCSNNIVMDATPESITKLKLGYEYHVKCSSKTMKVRDHYNIEHTVSVDDVETMIFELQHNYQVLLEKKWKLESNLAKKRTKRTIQSIKW